MIRNFNRSREGKTQFFTHPDHSFHFRELGCRGSISWWKNGSSSSEEVMKELRFEVAVGQYYPA